MEISDLINIQEHYKWVSSSNTRIQQGRTFKTHNFSQLANCCMLGKEAIDCKSAQTLKYNS